MPSTGRLASRMTEDESWALVAEQRKLQVATIGRDHVSLEAEAALERGDAAALKAFGRTR